MCKEDYKNKIQAQFKQNNTILAWQSVKAILGCNKSKKYCSDSNSTEFANDSNTFYCRFDCHNFEVERICAVQYANLLPEHTFKISYQASQCFKNLKVNKAAGPDKITGKLIKTCHLQLCSVFLILFQLCVELGEIPRQWKTAEILPIPNKPNPVLLNDYRPIALISLLMKSFERIVLKYMLPQVVHLLDPLQFAYRTKRSVEDATLSMLKLVLEHLERRGSYARILFVDFSSAFNTIQPHLMIRKLIDLGVSKQFVMVVHSFLTNRSLYVNVSGVCSSHVSISTGAPQGCVLSPFLYTMYTNSNRSAYSNHHYFKYADDTALVGLLSDDETDYRSDIDHFVSWCALQITFNCLV